MTSVRNPDHAVPVLDWTGERFLPELRGEIRYEHLHRYAICAEWVRDKDVLDIACGEGYGSGFLGRYARRVIGIDIDATVIRHAQAAYGMSSANLSYAVGKAEAIPLADASVDVVVSFETLEHHDQQRAMIEEIRRVLRRGGVLILSTPDKRIYSDEPHMNNSYHIKELYYEDLEILLSKTFEFVNFHGQRLAIGSFIAPLTDHKPVETYGAWTADVTEIASEEINRGAITLSDPVYFIVTCSDRLQPDIDASVFVDAADDLYLAHQQTIRQAHAANQEHSALASECDRLAADMKRRDGDIVDLRADLDQRQEELDRLTAEIVARDGEIVFLTAGLRQCQEELDRVHREFSAASAAPAQVLQPEPIPAPSTAATLRAALRRVPFARRLVRVWRRVARQPELVHPRQLKRWLREQRELRLLSGSKMFDAEYYLGTYPDVAMSGANPRRHYLRHGARERRDPHPSFRTAFYLEHHADVAAAGINPLVHYIRFGAAEGRQTNVLGAPIEIGRAEGGVARDRPLIAFVSGYPLTPSETYRVQHPRDVLAEEYSTLHITHTDLEAYEETLIQAAVLVLFRVAWTENLAQIVARARVKGCVVVYDVDDYVFEPAIANSRFIDGLRFLRESDIPVYRQGVRAYRQAIEMADYCTLSTEFLARRARDLGKTAYVLPNSVDPGMLGRFDGALKRRSERVAESRLRIGYAAGTLTHQRDFAIAGAALVEIFAAREDVILTIVGQLDLAEFPELREFADRIEIRKLVPHHELPGELARFDINIVPLELGNPFCESKSELKWFDSALLELPTVASATAPFRAAIRHGESGFLVRTREQWVASLTALIDDRRLRIRIGKCARGQALRRFGPGPLRENVRYIFAALLRHRRVVTPPRGGCYDNFLYALNYPALPLEQVAKRTIDLQSDRLCLHWIVPAFSVGWGGMTNILRIIQHLEKSGHRNTLWIHNPPAKLPSEHTVSSYYKEMIDDHFPAVVAEVHSLPVNLEGIRGDAVIATDHYSAYPARSVSNVRRRFYFLQDHEPDFSPAGYASLFARATYELGFDAISNGLWLHELAGEFGMWSAKWEQAADPDHYFTLVEENRMQGHIAFYARQETSRRAVELGYLAFELLAREPVDFHVDLFGSSLDPGNLTYPHTRHGILGAPELGRLYRQASIGMVFSATNYSIIPREMMACGLPVVELNSASSRRSFPDGVAALVEPTPENVAAHLKTLLLDGRRRNQLARRGIAFAEGFSWEKSGGEVESALLNRLGRRAA